jgi:hypothetical protein
VDEPRVKDEFERMKLHRDRDATIAQYQAWADHAAARGDERRRKDYQNAANRWRADRFDWETER